MTIAQIRNVCQPKLGIPSGAVAVLNKRSIGSGLEHRMRAKSYDELSFLTKQEVYVWQDYRGADTLLRPVR